MRPRRAEAGPAPPRLRALIVHYRTPELVRRALEPLRAASALGVEPLVVDNGSSPSDREVLSSLQIPILDSGENLGYAGAINRGVEASDSEFGAFLVLNPDVELLEGAVASLSAALAEADVVGPRFWWDAGRTTLLPPTEKRGVLDAILTALARPRPGVLRRWARARWRHHARRHHEARSALPSWSLSGAALLFRREAWERTGGFDEGYRLYFEETDWLLRLRRKGGRALFVPDAQARHSWGASTRSEPKATSWFETSCERFRRRHYGVALARLLARLERFPVRPEPEFGPQRLAGARWLELSPSPLGFPAASLPVDPGETRDLVLPPSLDDVRPAGDLWLRAVGPRGRELALRRLETLPGGRPH